MQSNNLVYLDYNATTPIDPECLNAMMEVLRIPANPSSIHYWGQKAHGFVEKARHQIAQALDIGLHHNDGYNCVFVSSGTEANNMILNSFMQTYNHGVIVTSAIEHSSVLDCAKEYESTKIIKVNTDGIVDLVSLANTLDTYKDRPLLVSVMLANNETGVIQPIEEIVNIAKKYRAWVHSDCCQAFSKMPLNVTKLNVDLISIASHKIYGPNGSAAIITKSPHFLVPQLIGGKQEKGLRSGTVNVAAIAGFGKAAMLAVNASNKNSDIQKLKEYLENTILSTDDKVKIFSSNVPRINNTTMVMMPNVTAQQQMLEFDINGYAVSAGSACSSAQVSSSHVLAAMGVPEDEARCAIRVSIGAKSTKYEIEKFCKLWQQKFIQYNSNINTTN